jgi:hypothetical protein
VAGSRAPTGAIGETSFLRFPSASPPQNRAMELVTDPNRPSIEETHRRTCEATYLTARNESR